MLLYYITDRKQFPGDEFERRQRLLEKILEAAQAGVDYIQMREKDLSSRELQQLGRETVQRVREASNKTRVLVNSRTDIALAVGADGVHLRSNDISPEEARNVWRQARADAEPIIAVSCHTEGEVEAAKRSGAEFVVFGPVFEKPGELETGLGMLRSACRHEVPVLALGGVTGENADSCVAAGAAGVAGIRLFQENDVMRLVEMLGA